MQNKNEIEQSMISNDIKKISIMILELRKNSWQKLKTENNENLSRSNESLKIRLQQELKLFLDKYRQDMFNDERGYLIAKFILSFSFGSLEEEEFNSIRKEFLASKEKYPILLQTDSIIAFFRNHLFNFFISYGDNYDKNFEKFFIDKTKNPIADLIIDTEIKRTMIDYHDRPNSINSDTKFIIHLNELDDKFEIELKKIYSI
jgi:hypothetical protein